MLSSDKFTLRLATHADKEAVLGLRSDAMGGYDYLPAYYDHFMSDANRESIVCELDGKVVGFLAMNIVDGGRSYMAQGGRVSKEVEGQGVFRRLVDYCRARARETGCVRELMSTNHMNQRMNRAGKNMILKKGRLGYEFDEQKKQAISRQIAVGPGTNSELKSIEGDDFYPLFKNPDKTSYWLPTGWIMLDWVLLKAAEVNINRLKGRNTRFLSDVDVKPESGLVSALTQFHRPRSGHINHVCIVDVFGNDTTAIERHLHYYLGIVLGTGGTVGVVFNVDESMVPEILRQLRSFGLYPSRWHKDLPEDGIAWQLGFETLL